MVKVSLTTFKSIAVYLLCVLVFSSLSSISRVTPCQPVAETPLSNETAHRATDAVQAQDSDTDFGEEDNFVKLHAIRSFPLFRYAGWHLYDYRSPFFKIIEIYSLLPRFPPF